MRRLFVLLCYSIALLLFISACDKTEDASSDFTDYAVAFGEEFIKKLYSIDDTSLDFNSMSVESLIDIQNNFSSYLTEKEFEKLESKRFFLMPLEAASTQNSTISVGNIEFKKYDRDQAESVSIDLNHSFTLFFKDQAGNDVDEVEIKGQITVVDNGNGLKMDRYYDNEIPVDMLHS